MINNLKKYFSIFLFFLLIIYLSCIVLLSSVPPVSRDALVHHLALPKMYLKNGGIYEIPSMHFSYFPMNLDLLYLVPLHFNIDFGAKYIHFIFSILTSVLIYKYLATKINNYYATIGAILFLTIPIIVKLSITVYVDLGLIFFSWAGLYYFLKWYDHNFKLKYLIFCGLFSGLALGTKYNGLILLPIFSILIALTYSLTHNFNDKFHNKWQRYKNSILGVQYAAIFIIISLLVFSPWMIRNTIWKQNPIYPLYNNVFNPAPSTPEDKTITKSEDTTSRNAFWYRKNIYNESLLQSISIPFRAFFQGKDNNPKFFDGKLNPFLLIFSLLALCFYILNRGNNFYSHHLPLAAFASLFILFVLFMSDFRIRYMGPAIPPIVILSIYGLRDLFEYFKNKKNLIKVIGLTTTVTITMAAFSYNGIYIYDQFQYVQPFKYIFNKVDRHTYISHFLQEYPLMQYANDTLPMEAKVLCLSIGDRTYYLDRSVHLADDFYKKSRNRYSIDNLIMKVNRYDTTHIIINRGVYNNWIRHLPKSEQVVFESFFQNHTSILHHENNVYLLKYLPNEHYSSLDRGGPQD